MLKLPDKHARIIDQEWNTGLLFTRLIRYARAGHDPDWGRQHVAYEARASEIKVYEPSVVPGIAQTEEYALISFTRGGSKDPEAAARARIARKEAVFNRADSPLLWILLNWPVLEQFVGEPRVLAAQLRHLVELSLMPNVILRVIPKSAGWHLGLEGGFVALTVDRVDVAYTEACGGGGLVRDTAEARSYATRFELIGAEALTPSATRALIKEVLESLDE